jgi:hypothetical protein
MDEEQIDARARDYAHTYILMCLIDWHKKIDPVFVSEIGRSFDEYIGKHELVADNAFKQQVIGAARKHLRGLIENESLTVHLKQ